MIKEILKELAIDESSVDVDNVISYLQEHTEPLAPEYEVTINLWLSRIEGTDQLPSNHEQNTADDGTAHEPNDYDDDPHSE